MVPRNIKICTVICLFMPPKDNFLLVYTTHQDKIFRCISREHETRVFYHCVNYAFDQQLGLKTYKKALDLVSERKWKERPQKIIHTTLKLNLYYRGPRNVGYKSGTHVTILQNAHSVTFMLFLWHPFMGKVCICSSRPFRSFWDFLGLFGTFWDFLGPLGTFRDL